MNNYQMKKTKYFLYGFSLFECLIAITLMLILSTICCVTWNRFISKNEMKTQSQKLINILEYTKLLAIKNSQNFSFCRIATKQQSNLNDWSAGQIIKDDHNNTLKTFDITKSNYKLYFYGNFGKGDCVTFTPIGITNGQQGSFHCREKRKMTETIIIIQLTGHIYLKNNETISQGNAK